jgi:hypothetical protein
MAAELYGATHEIANNSRLAEIRNRRDRIGRRNARDSDVAEDAIAYSVIQDRRLAQFATAPYREALVRIPGHSWPGFGPARKRQAELFEPCLLDDLDIGWKNHPM